MENPLGNSNSFLNGARKWIVRSLKLVACAFALYVIVIGIGLIPVNQQFVNHENGIEIFVVSNDVHAELILPVDSMSGEWKEWFADSEFSNQIPSAKYLGFGWGDREFFVDTPTWADFKISTAARALCLPSETAIHVSAFRNETEIWEGARKVSLSPEQFEQLKSHVQDAFLKSEKSIIEIEGAHYSDQDAFFEANGNYHLMNTCNSWVGRGLKRAGVCVGQFTPLPKTVFLYLPSDSNSKDAAE